MSFQRQDLSGYLSVLRFRGGRTVLVEGPTDKRALARALHEFERHGRVGRGLVVVDSADTVDVSRSGCGVGARAVVEYVHAAARAAGFDVYALVDREFRMFSADADAFRDDVRGHHQAEPSLVWTRGHSIENFFFEPEYAQDFLRYRYSDQLKSEAIDAVALYWREALQNVAALSVAARDAGLLSRLCGALSVSAWEIPTARSIGIVAYELERAAAARGLSASDAGSFRARFEALLPAAKTCADAECARWISHGHLGDEAMWLAVGKVLLENAAPACIVQEVGCGYRDEKRYHRADRWAQMHRDVGSVETPIPLWRSLGVAI